MNSAAISQNPAGLVLEALACTLKLLRLSDAPGVPAVAAQELQAIERRQGGASAFPGIIGETPEHAVLNTLHEVCSMIHTGAVDPGLSEAALAELERIDARLVELERRAADAR